VRAKIIETKPLAGGALIAAWLTCGFMMALATPVSPAAERVAATIDALDVEHHWPAGIHVNWQTEARRVATSECRGSTPTDAVAGSYMSRQDKPGKGGSSM
jgi:hypothetical protein